MSKNIKILLFMLFCAHFCLFHIRPLYAYEVAPRISDREIIESLTELKQGQKALNQRLDDMNHNLNKRFEGIDKRLDAMDLNFNKRMEEMNSSFNKRMEEMNSSFNKRMEEMNSSFNKRMEEMNSSFNKRLDEMNSSLNKRIDEMNSSLNKRIDEMNSSFNERFEIMDKRFEEMHDTMLVLYTSTMAIVVSMMGYLIWDRRTSQKPLKSKVKKLAEDMSAVEEELETQLNIRNPEGPVVPRLLDALRQLARTDEKLASVLRSFSLL
ncbi:conserved exported hypothetical protein [Desulfamplus magnetovallimortis]|uniref:Uncharacterized protein n=1 Tax=Desulfamplus magnetovallimortis TaxID=1246637 RepID=A0A1W1HDE7_9BACT|nr:hypothetical protein [Desulfamplus magnetovallimortis]SLM30453.1 conserved exported hypothetical protein [Desulfamplus magnetovallimortis]